MFKRIVFKKIVWTALLALVLVALAGGVAEANTGPKTLNVYYNDIKLNVDGVAIKTLPAQEPFIVDGVTFVPVRIIAEALNFNVDWQPDTRSVVITSKTPSEVTNLIQLVQKKDEEIQSLKQQIEQLKQQLEATQGTSTSTSISSLRTALKDKYDSIGDVDIDSLDLQGDKDSVTVKIWVDLDEYEDEWADLSNSEIKSWLTSLVKYIQNKLSNSTNITGRIINSDNDDVLIKFTKKGTGSLSVSYQDEDYRNTSDASEAIEELEDKTYYVDTIKFTVTDVQYSESSDRATLKLKATSSSARSTWEDLSSSKLKSEVLDICEEVVDVFDDAGISLAEVKLYFYDSSSTLLKSFLYDVDEETLS
ncbi:MAG: stalk domain-containing protein [Moorellaceae bacterium]